MPFLCNYISINSMRHPRETLQHSFCTVLSGSEAGYSENGITILMADLFGLIINPRVERLEHVCFSLRLRQKGDLRGLVLSCIIH